MHNLQFYISDTHVTLKQNQGQQTFNENVGPKQGYNHAKFERSHFHSIRLKGNVNFFFQMRMYVNYLPWTCKQIRNSGIFMVYLT